MYYYRYVVLVMSILAIFVGAAIKSGSVAAFAQMGIADTVQFGVASTTGLLSLVGGSVAFAVLVRTRSALSFADEVFAEVMRVTWPTRDEAVRAATTVVATTMFVALVISVYDLVWKKLADLVLFNQG